MSQKIDFVSLGFCSNDYLALLPEIPIDSKVQMLEHVVQGGGPAATAAVAAARLGFVAAFMGVVGDDDPGKRMLAEFQSEKVNISGMVIRPGFLSPIAYCWIDAPTGKRSVAWTRGNLPEMQADEVNLELVRNARLLHLDGHNPKAALAAARFARENGIVVSLDAGTLRDGIRELLPYVDVFIASEAFARSFSGEKELDRAIYKLAEVGSAVVGITLGEGGSMVLDGGRILRQPAFRIKPVDTTGAGDTYHAAFAVRYLETHDLADCMRFASAVAAIKCLKLGGRTGLPSRAQVDEFLKKHAE